MRFLSVGSAYVHGIMGGVCLLGPLPEHVAVTLGHDRNGDRVQTFLDLLVRTSTTNDLRLTTLSTDWKENVSRKMLW
jgi:hypothetical protein